MYIKNELSQDVYVDYRLHTTSIVFIVLLFRLLLSFALPFLRHLRRESWTAYVEVNAPAFSLGRVGSRLRSGSHAGNAFNTPRQRPLPRGVLRPLAIFGIKHSSLSSTFSSSVIGVLLFFPPDECVFGSQLGRQHAIQEFRHAARLPARVSPQPGGRSYVKRKGFVLETYSNLYQQTK